MGVAGVELEEATDIMAEEPPLVVGGMQQKNWGQCMRGCGEGRADEVTDDGVQLLLLKPLLRWRWMGARLPAQARGTGERPPAHVCCCLAKFCWKLDDAVENCDATEGDTAEALKPEEAEEEDC